MSGTRGAPYWQRISHSLRDLLTRYHRTYDAARTLQEGASGPQSSEAVSLDAPGCIAVARAGSHCWYFANVTAHYTCGFCGALRHDCPPEWSTIHDRLARQSLCEHFRSRPTPIYFPGADDD